MVIIHDEIHTKTKSNDILVCLVSRIVSRCHVYVSLSIALPLSLSLSLPQECRSLREKREVEVEDLEWIAQQHAQRADRLNVELEAAREQIEVMKRSLMALEVQSGKDDKLVDTISSLKQDIQQVKLM